MNNHRYNEIGEEIIYLIGEEFVRSTKHTIKYTNISKIKKLSDFINEYRKVSSLIINELWKNGYSHIDKSGNKHIFNVHKKLYDLPKYLDYNRFNFITTDLSARALSSLITQITSLINGLIKSKTFNKKGFLSKPSMNNINPELSSKCMDMLFIKSKESKFDMFIQIKCIGNKYGKIKIPINYYEYQIDKYQKNKNYELLNSISLDKNFISLRWIYKSNKILNNKTQVVGIDPGINNIVSLSNNQIVKKINKDNKTFKDILNKIDEKQNYSKNQKKSLIEKDNFIKEIMNTIDFTDIKEIRFEYNKGLKQSTNNLNHYWSYYIIVNQIKKLCEDNQVDLIFTKSAYKSQRCFECGFVLKKNRKKNIFCCLNCNHKDDADLNAAKNNSILLEKIDFKIINKKRGFFWKSF